MSSNVFGVHEREIEREEKHQHFIYCSRIAVEQKQKSKPQNSGGTKPLHYSPPLTVRPRTQKEYSNCSNVRSRCADGVDSAIGNCEGH